MKNCSICGAESRDHELFCESCGSPFEAPESAAAASLPAASLPVETVQVEEEAEAVEPPEPQAAPASLARQILSAGGDLAVLGPDVDVDAEPDSTGLSSVFSAQGDMVVTRPTVNLVQPPPTDFCPVCHRHHPQAEMFLCRDCHKYVGMEHQVEGLGICTLCAARAYEIAVSCAADPDAGGYRVTLTSTLLADDWQEESQFDPADLPTHWRDSFTQQPDGDAFSSDLLAAELGRPLFGALLASHAWSVLKPDFARRSEHQSVHIRLVDLPRELAGWPWEAMTAEKEFLALSRHTPVVRWLSRNGAATLSSETGPLRILTFAGQAEGAELLTSEFEATQLEGGIVNPGEGAGLEVQPLSLEAGEPISDQLRKALATHTHILHLAGSFEVEFDPDGPVLVLAAGGRVERLRLEVLSHWLKTSRVQVVVFGCRLKHGDVMLLPTDPRLQLPELLLCGNVAALVAFQFDLLPDQVRDFAEAFYGKLAARNSNVSPRPGLSEAMEAGRAALLDPVRGDATLAWVAPMLFTRPFEGAFLDLKAPTAAATAQVRSYAPFVEEPVGKVQVDEAPLCTDRSLELVRQERLHLVVGSHDAGGLDLTRQIARRLSDAGECSLVLRFPGYDRSGLLANLRTLAQGKERVAVIYETDGWDRGVEELDDMLALVKGRTAPLFLLLSITIRDEPEGDFDLWLKRNPGLWTPLTAKDYSPEILGKVLERETKEARGLGRLHPVTANTLLELSQKGKLFGSKEGQISLPRQLVRLIYGLLPGQPPVRTEAQLRQILKTLSDAPEDLRHWFAESLTDSQRALVLGLSLFQGLPAHLFVPIYRQIVGRLRKAFQIDLSVLPLGAELRRWPLYLEEVRRRGEGGQQVSFIEFASEFVEDEILALLQQDYGEWLLELVTLLGDLACSNQRLEVQGPAWAEADHRLVRAAATRALGEVGRSNERALGLVALDAERWLTADWPNVPPESDRQVRAIPAQVLRYVAESGKRELEGGLLATLNRWQNHKHYKVRWTAASACGRLAGVLPIKRVLPIYTSLANKAREDSQKAFQDALRRTNNDLRATAADPAYVEALQVYQSATYALRMLRPADFSAVLRVYDQAAGEENLGVRINVAIALDRVAAEQPAAAAAAILSWANPAQWAQRQKWTYWWTAAAAATLLVEHECLPAGALSDLWSQMLVFAKGLPAENRNRRAERLAGHLIWAMEACQSRDAEESGGPPPLSRVLNLIGTLLGTDPWLDRVIGIVFERTSTADKPIRAAVFAALEVWLQPECYELLPSRRRVAVEAYLQAGAEKRQAATRLLRELAKFEAFDYSALGDAAYGQKAGEDLGWLGLGGLLLQTVTPDSKESVARLLPLLETFGSIKDPHVRSLAPFVVRGLPREHEDQVLDALKLWARRQWPLQLSVAETVLAMYRRDADRPERLEEVLVSLAEAPADEVRGYLEQHLGDLAEVSLPAAARLREAMSKANARR